MRRISKIVIYSLLITIFLFVWFIYRNGINNENYLHKIWIDEGKIKEDGRYQGFSFVITQMDFSTVKGQYVTDWDEINPQRGGVRTFEGTVDGSTIRCKLFDEGVSVGSMSLEVMSNNRIHVTYTCRSEGTVLYEQLACRPYNIEDLLDEKIILKEELAVSTEIDGWGKIKVIPGVVDINNRYPVAFMTNEQGDILFEFKAGYKVGTTIQNIRIDDYNEDGFVDVEIETFFKDENIPPIYWYFQQDEGATFHLESVL